jgi:hypothetical protein
VSGSDPERSFSWYDVLGVLPGASAAKIQRTYDDKMSLLRPELISGAPSNVLKAAGRAQEILEAARRVLGDPGSRARYDEAAGFRRSGQGLVRPEGFPSDPGWGPADLSFAGGLPGEEVLVSIMALMDWLGPHPRPRGRVPVPDVRGLFYAVCLEVAGRLGLQLRAVRLTEHPVPVDGLVVDQSPMPPSTVRRGTPLTVQVWHPPGRR